MILIAAILLVLASPAQAIMLVGFGDGGAAPSCDTQSVVISETTEGGDHCIWLSGAPDWENTRGQAFIVDNNITAYSIIVKGYVASGGTCNITMRIGTSSNLTSYISQADPVACIDNGGTADEYEFLFPASRPSLSTGVTYYFGMTTDAVTVDNSFCVRRTTSDTYAGGSEWKASATTWNMDSELTTRDMYFKVKKCD